MKKKSSTILIFILCVLFVNSIFTANLAAILKDDTDHSVNTLTTPRSSAADVTLLWSYTQGSMVQDVALSKDGNYIAAINTTDVFLLNKTSNNPLWNYTTLDAPSSVVISGDGKYIAVQTVSRSYLFNNSQDTPKTRLWFLIPPALPSRGIAISEDGKYIATIHQHRLYHLNNSYSTETDEDILPEWKYDFFPLSGADPQSVAISADGKYIAVGCDDGFVYFFNTTKTTPKTYEWRFDMTTDVHHVNIGYDLAKDLYYIVAASRDDTEVYLLNSTFENQKSTTVWNASLDSNIFRLAISSNGNKIICGDGNSYSCFDNAYSAALKTPLWDRAVTGPSSVDMNADGSYMVLGGTVTSTYLVNANNETLWYNSEDVNNVRISGLGDYFLRCNPNIYFYHHKLPEGNHTPNGGDEPPEDLTGLIITLAIVGGLFAGIIIYGGLNPEKMKKLAEKLRGSGKR